MSQIREGVPHHLPKGEKRSGEPTKPKEEDVSVPRLGFQAANVRKSRKQRVRAQLHQPSSYLRQSIPVVVALFGS